MATAITLEQQLDLVERKLAKVSKNGNLWTFKYARKVMYEYLWNKYPELKECRGQTYDATTGELVLNTPTKSFNYLENGTWKDKPMDSEVLLFKKYNGFMASASLYNGQLIVGTTGSTSSNFAALARKHIELTGVKNCMCSSVTYLFEIIDDSDPHIIDEGDAGVRFLGTRFNHKFFPSGEPLQVTLQQALELTKTDRGEGWMMYNPEDMTDVCKLKTDYYVGKKKLMRLPSKSTRHTLQSEHLEQLLPGKWKEVLKMIRDTQLLDEWEILTAQQRRLHLESLYET